ncbi:MAG TPA: peptide ABC transporter substrate-binding protein [Chloroflexota bacterium]|nr:peptide ABC transporter substrate-binding protein [Chloroflexota bacterium]
MALAEKVELTRTSRRGFLVKTGTGAAAAAALSVGGSSAAFAQMAGNVLRLNTGSEPDTIDPQKASFVSEIEKIMMVFRNLLQFDKDGNLVADQAVGMPALDEGGTLMTFRLRDDITFSDGKPVTAQDFVYGWRRHMDPRTNGEYSFLGYIIAGGEAYNTADPAKVGESGLAQLREALGVRALDDKTVQFKLNSPAPWFLSVLSTWCGVPTREDKVMAGNGGIESESKWTEPATYIGNGPYILTDWEHQNRMHFRANPSYFTGPPPIAERDFAMINEPAVAFAAYLNDELDVTGVQTEDRPRVNSDPALSAQFQQYAGSCTFYVGFNIARPPFNDTRVRRAFSFGLDRTSFVRNILGGAGLPARQFLPPGFPGYYEFELEEQVFNPSVGRALLAEAGYPNGQGLPTIKYGFSSSARNKTRAEAIAAQYKQSLGVTIELDPIESRAFTAAMKQPATTPQSFLLGWCQDYPDPQNWYSTVWHSKSAIQHSSWNNAEFDYVTSVADTHPDPQERRNLYLRAAQILLNDVPAAMLYHNVVWRLVKPRLKGTRPDPLERFLGENDLYNLKIEG